MDLKQESNAVRRMLVNRLPLNFVLVLIACAGVPIVAVADEPPKAAKQLIKHQVTGLFSPDREQDLKEVFQKLPDFKLVSIDFANAEVSVEYDTAKVFPGANADQVIERFDNLVRNASTHTFGIKALRTVEKDKLKQVEIAVVGLDCKACSLAAYEAIFRLKGVESATASFKEGRVTALINPQVIDRVELETALKQRGVEIKPPATDLPTKNP
jgi:copper chaperone CopZ